MAESWWIAFRSPLEIYEKHSNFLVAEIALYTMAVLTLGHAFRIGGRYRSLWFAALLHGVVTETVCYWTPEINNFWHAQSSVMMLGKRLPLYIMLCHPVFNYVSNVAASRLKLGIFPTAYTSALADCVSFHVFDIIAIKLLWWTWHDTDPTIYERHFWVPFTSTLYRLTFSPTFTLFFYGTHKVMTGKRMLQAGSFLQETASILLTGLLTFPAAVATHFIPLYHSLHDALGASSEVCVLAVIYLYILIVWVSDRNGPEEARPRKKGKHPWKDELTLVVLIHFLTFAGLVVFAKPESIVSTGVHEPLGPCNETVHFYNAIGQVVSKRKYLCPTDYDEGYMDFHCVHGGKAPPGVHHWYTICGTPYENHAEYITVVWGFCLLGLAYYYNLLACSGLDEAPNKKHKTN
ncbi:Hypp745 [Branchiostoma lanceolatum]|uniref:Hypp745 protein n=2 Tax=Branchiostoma lanceolatum TaxID=7740 RepID=A0A8J9VCY9_BRALA|nr:Hypp745 [Branchiostoma lanceolatum]